MRRITSAEEFIALSVSLLLYGPDVYEAMVAYWNGDSGAISLFGEVAIWLIGLWASCEVLGFIRNKGWFFDDEQNP